jgi:hypothetical protein
MSRIVGVWERLDPSATAIAPESDAEQKIEEEDAKPSRAWRTIHRLDILAAVFWLNAFTKVFISDWDRSLVRKLAPNAEWIINFRILLFSIVLLALFKLGKKWSLLWIAYVIIWPLAVIVWRIPRLIHKKAGWNGLVGLAHVFSGFLRGVKWSLAAVVLLVASLLFLALPGTLSAWIASISAFGLLCWLLYTSIRSTLTPSRFMGMQKRLFSLYRGIAPTEEYDNLRPAIEGGGQLDAEQTKTFLTQAGNSLVASRVVYFWAYRVNEYRKSWALIVFNALSVVWLFVTSVVAFTLINLGLFQANPNAFELTGRPSAVKFFYYSAVSTSGGETTLIQPVGDIAVAVKTLEFIVGTILIVTLFVSIFLGFRASRDDRDARETVEAIRVVAKEAEAEFTANYGCTPTEAIQRLSSIGHTSIGTLALLSVPEAFMSPDEDRDPGSIEP